MSIQNYKFNTVSASFAHTAGQAECITDAELVKFLRHCISEVDNYKYHYISFNHLYFDPCHSSIDAVVIIYRSFDNKPITIICSEDSSSPHSISLDTYIAGLLSQSETTELDNTNPSWYVPEIAAVPIK